MWGGILESLGICFFKNVENFKGTRALLFAYIVYVVWGGGVIQWGGKGDTVRGGVDTGC